MGKRALLAWGLETEEKQIGGYLESSTYFSRISFPELYYFCNGNWELASGLSVHTVSVRIVLEQGKILDSVGFDPTDPCLELQDSQGKHSYAPATRKESFDHVAL